MKILVSNDDGVLAPGIQQLSKTLTEIAKVQIVAPDRNRSGASNSLSLSRPLRLKNHAENVIAVEGTPTDCVHLALTGLMPELPDMVISGINHGANLGDDILYSGTVAAAMEGRYLGLPAIAVSLSGESYSHFLTAALITKNVVLALSRGKLPSQTILNINVPDLPIEEIRGIEVTRLGTRHSAEPTIKAADPRGNPIYWIGPPGSEQDAGPGTDFYALKRHFVSITPLQLDMTHYSAFDQISSWVSGIKL